MSTRKIRKITRELCGVEVSKSIVSDMVKTLDPAVREWREFFKSLKARGLSGVDLVVSDDHGGLVNAVAMEFQGASWQLCQTHFTKNILDACPKALKDELHFRLRLMFEAPDIDTARESLGGIIADFADRAPGFFWRWIDGAAGAAKVGERPSMGMRHQLINESTCRTVARLLQKRHLWGMILKFEV